MSTEQLAKLQEALLEGRIDKETYESLKQDLVDASVAAEPSDSEANSPGDMQELFEKNHVVASVVVEDVWTAVEFYEKAFGLKVYDFFQLPSEKVVLANVVIGNIDLQIRIEDPDWGDNTSFTHKGSPVNFLIATQHVDKLYRHAVATGCTEVCAPDEWVDGSRLGAVADPFGIIWRLVEPPAEDISLEEIKQQVSSIYTNRGF